LNNYYNIQILLSTKDSKIWEHIMTAIIDVVLSR